MSERPNQQIANGVNQDTGTTAEELIKRRDGEYKDQVQDAAESRSRVPVRKDTVKPF